MSVVFVYNLGGACCLLLASTSAERMSYKWHYIIATRPSNTAIAASVDIHYFHFLSVWDFCAVNIIRIKHSDIVVAVFGSRIKRSMSKWSSRQLTSRAAQHLLTNKSQSHILGRVQL